MKKEKIDAFYDRVIQIKDFILFKDYLRSKSDTIEKNLYIEHFLLQIVILWVLQDYGFLNADRRYLISSFCGYTQKNRAFRTYFEFLQELFKIMRGEVRCGVSKDSGAGSPNYFNQEGSNDHSISRRLDLTDEGLINDKGMVNGSTYHDSDFGAIIITGSGPFLQLDSSNVEILDEAFYNPKISFDSKIRSKFKNGSLPIFNFLECWVSTEGGIDEYLIGALYEKIMTKEKRKSSGSYYTPKEITSFICKSTIEDYLSERMNFYLAKFNSAVQAGNMLPSRLDRFEDVFKVDSADFYLCFYNELRNLTILDPAVGAGHFLISAIDSLAEIYQKLWLRLTELQIQNQFSIFSNDEANGRESSVDMVVFFHLDPTKPGARERFLLTLHHRILLPNTIFGVDINPIAIDIARARLFLSMAKYYDCSKPLPNLYLSHTRFNLQTGNSLVGFDGESHIKHRGFGQIQRSFLAGFDGDSYSKNNEHDASESRSCASISNSRSFPGFSNIDYRTFQWKIAFRAVFEKEGGFDIVLGNPPYVGLIENKSLREYLEREYADIYEGKADLWFYFLYNGVRLLKPHGQLSFVVSRYFLNAPIAKKLNLFLVDHTHIRNIWDFRGYKIFPGTNIQNLIIHVSKKERDHITSAEPKIKYRFLPDFRIINKNNSLFSQFSILQVPQAEIREHLIKYSKMNFQLYEDGGIYLRIAEKVKHKLSKTLGDCAMVSKGILTGNDAVFTVSKDVIEKYGLEARFLRNYVKNSNIKPYHLDYDKSLFVIISHKRNTDILSKEAPNILKYFEDMRAQNRLSTASRSIKNPTQWRNGDERFTIDWEKPKIVTPYRSKCPCFALDVDRYFVPQDVVLIYPKSEAEYENTLYLWLSYFNSVIFEVLMVGGKDSGGMKDYLPGQIEPLPIPLYDPDQEFHKKIVELTKEIVKNPSNLHLEQQLLDIWIKIFNFDEPQKEKLLELERSRIARNSNTFK